MTDTIQTETTPAEATEAVVYIPLNKLKKHPLNARKKPHSEASIEAKAASIHAKGILQNLVVEPERKASGEPTGCYLVTIGEGRRQAQLLRVKRKQIKKTEPIRCVIVINTDRRTYHLELRAGVSTYMASVSWTYPQDQLIALRAANASAASVAPVASGIDVSALNFRYRIDGDRAPWKPLRAFDDGRQVFVEFPAGISQGEMPPLFVTGAAGDAELVNYRVQGRYMVVDRLFASAELRLGDRRSEQRVRIVRTDGRRGRP